MSFGVIAPIEAQSKESVASEGVVSTDRGSRAPAADHPDLDIRKEIPYACWKHIDSVWAEPMIKSRLTTKAQTTIPRPVRAALRLRVGDEIAYEIEGDRAILSKASPTALDDPFVTFSEWNSEADRKGYADL